MRNRADNEAVVEGGVGGEEGGRRVEAPKGERLVSVLGAGGRDVRDVLRHALERTGVEREALPPAVGDGYDARSMGEEIAGALVLGQSVVDFAACARTLARAPRRRRRAGRQLADGRRLLGGGIDCKCSGVCGSCSGGCGWLCRCRGRRSRQQAICGWCWGSCTHQNQ